MGLLPQTGSIILLILGFGFVVFFHELGHFIAAKWVGIKVEQFAVGFGQALFSWRKGLGLTWGSSAKKLEALQEQQRQGVPGINTSHIGETEYRVNWLPLGGYVKMLGQDDLKPGADAEDPRAFNKKSISARMLVVSAGVVMNVILAGLGFMALFLMGYKVPPAIVGSIAPDSPAQHAGLHVGDRILYFDGKYQHDFAKISLAVALVKEDQPIPILVRHPDGTEQQLTITPARARDEKTGLLAIGIGKPVQLIANTDKDSLIPENYRSPEFYPAEMLAIHPGDKVVQINGQAIDPHKDFYKLDRALQTSAGQPVALTVLDAKGNTRIVNISPRLQATFSGDPLNFAGMIPRPMIHLVPETSPAKGKLLPDDAIVSVSLGGLKTVNPTFAQFIEIVNNAGQQDRPVQIEVLRNGKVIPPIEVKPAIKLPNGRIGFGIAMDYYDPTPIVAGLVEDSPARQAGIPDGARILSVNNHPVQSWFQVKDALASANPAQPLSIVAQTPSGPKDFTLHLTADQIRWIAGLRYSNPLMLNELASVFSDQVEPRKTSNPFVAAAWGAAETRDFILQFYITLQRMFQGSVSYKNMMGPVGIVTTGAHFAFKGIDWLIWFLSMISANLAVVNFLPIPIVDGGLFTFLILEKIKGKPLSQRAQSVAQVIGLALILGVFLLVTYQDIVRLIHH